MAESQNCFKSFLQQIRYWLFRTVTQTTISKWLKYLFKVKNLVFRFVWQDYKKARAVNVEFRHILVLTKKKMIDFCFPKACADYFKQKAGAAKRLSNCSYENYTSESIYYTLQWFGPFLSLMAQCVCGGSLDDKQTGAAVNTNTIKKERSQHILWMICVFLGMFMLSQWCLHKSPFIRKVQNMYKNKQFLRKDLVPVLHT